jgi:hypothetical protein
MRQTTDHSQEPVTQKEAELRWHTTLRRTLSKMQLRKLYNDQGELTAKWETRDGQVELVGNGLTIVFTRSAAGQVVGTVKK